MTTARELRFTRDELLTCMERFALLGWEVHVRAWTAPDDWHEQLQKRRPDWTGPYIYEISVECPEVMYAKQAEELIALCREYGWEPTFNYQENSGRISIGRAEGTDVVG